MAPVSLTWWQIVAVLGAVQGGFLVLALLTRRRNRTPNRILAAAVGVLALFLASTVYYTADLVARAPHLFGLSQPLPFLIGPLFYLYAVTASGRRRSLDNRDLWHFVPALLVIATTVPIYLQSGAEKLALFRRIQAGDLPIQAAIASPLMLVSGVAYTIATLLLLRRHRRVMADNYSSLRPVNLTWLGALAVGSGLVWLLAVGLELVAGVGGVPVPESEMLMGLAITVMIYGIGYWGLRQPEIFRFATAEHPIPTPVTTAASGAAPPEEESPQRYERSGLPPREAEELKARLVAHMEEEQPYRRSELTLGELAEQLRTTPHRLSEVLNGQLAMNFYDFVNSHRVREVQQRLTGPDGSRYTYLALGLEAGFASKSTFNAAFKKHTGMTPSEYRSARAN